MRGAARHIAHTGKNMAKKTIYFDKLCGFSVTAVTENGKVTDCKFSADDDAPAVGNIYRGRVVNVLEGMQAAFVDCGLERNCYLSAEDVPYGTEGGVSGLRAGDELMVQIVKTPSGKKGAKVTAKPSFVGKTLIYLPNTDFVGISHRIEDDELRESLIFAAKRAKRKGEGMVIRNAAPFCTYEQIDEELKFLRTIYERTAEAFRRAKAGELIHTDFTMPVRVMRNFTEYDVAKIVTGRAEQYEEIKELLSIMPGGRQIKLELYSGGRDMLEQAGLAAQIAEACSERVELKGGAYLIIERTEALTSIDVNTGGFTGEDSLEYTVYHTNLAAAREIARQVKLRNIGGLFVVDFIDMAEEGHRRALVQELEKALQSDAAPHRVLPMSDFGLVEFTRKRSGAELSSFVIQPCPVCGYGRDYSNDFYMLLCYSEALKALDGGAAAPLWKCAPKLPHTLPQTGRSATAYAKNSPAPRYMLCQTVQKRAGNISAARRERGLPRPTAP